MYPHRIRLRGPWECEPLSNRVTMPGRCCDLGLAGIRGRVLFRRRFGYPGRIDVFERVLLTFDEIAGLAEIALNGHPLAKDATGRWQGDVTTLLRERNQLDVAIQVDSDDAGLPGEVAMMIRCQAWLENVRIEDGFAVGDLLGTSPGPLDLYVRVGGENVGYASWPELTQRCQFRVPVPEGTAAIRVELVQGATTWFVAEGV